MDTRTKITKGYASGFLFLKFIKVPENPRELEIAIELLFNTYNNSISADDSLAFKTNKLMNLLSMHDFIDRIGMDNKLAYSAIKNCIQKWIELIEEDAVSSIPAFFNDRLKA